jgi:kinesin family protein 3/17
LIGGKKMEDTPQFKNALEERQRAIREEYEGRLGELERERHQIEEDKAQVDRYKQLLLKQRDIMIALTSRLNERDETII